MAESSRKGRKIARKACDLCRDRRMQCAFDNVSPACRKCLQYGVPCTFLTDRRPRGPPSRRVADARQYAPSSRLSEQTPPPLPLGPVTVAHFVPESMFLAILDDFLVRVYPVLPLVHVPSFTCGLNARAFETDTAFFRLCVSLCAVTVASIPRNIERYGSTWYKDAAEMVDRASHLVLMSRLATTPEWQNRASVESMVVSVLLAMASHYAGRPNAGWAYASEAVHFFRELELYKRSAYDAFSPVERELCKRSFWLLFIIQIHDRMSFTIPHTGLSYDPQDTDWEFLLPLELTDEQLLASVPHSADTTPVISGFVALIKVFLCIADLLDKSFPGPPSYFGLSPGALGLRLLPGQNAHNQHIQTPPDMPFIDSLFQVMSRLDATLSDLPEQLRLPRRGKSRPSEAGDNPVPRASTQFEIMRANIHITGIYMQSMILEMCLNKLQSRDRTTISSDSGPSPAADSSVSAQLWHMKESVARELLDILSGSSAHVLESNGSSMIKKIREVAATFLDQDSCPVDSPVSDMERRSREYLAQFVEILADLDYMPKSPV